MSYLCAINQQKFMLNQEQPYQNKTVAYYTLGCRLNFAESSTLAYRLSELGFERQKGNRASGADLLVVNTCAVTEQATAKCRQQIRKLIRENPDAFVVVTGCYAQIEPKELADSIGGIDLIVGSEFKGENIAACLGNLTKKPEAPKEEPRKCPFCCSEIAKEATRCPHCTSELPKYKAA
jgi:tRNA A37 methylthiotransferase MiaB